MRIHDLRPAALSAAIISCLPFTASAQLEEIIVTATRRETDLQSTPLSVQAFSAEQLELGGIDNGRDLGIMVPNVVLNPSTGGAQSQFYIRGLPGVGLYVDGVWQDGFGFQQMNFSEMERVEVLRGPQGTLFGRNTNGGAVNMTTRLPGEEFGARVKLDVGDFNRRDASLAVDVPITDTLKTKFMAATARNDGFLEGLTTPWDFGAQDDTIYRADIYWEPADTFSLRFTYNDEQKRGTDPRIHRMTRYDNSKLYAYNILLGGFQQQANAACAAGFTSALAPAAGVPQPTCGPGGWTPPPANTIGTRYTGVKPPLLDPSTHTTNYPDGFIGATTSQFGNYEQVLNAAGQPFETLGTTYTPNPRMADYAFGGGQVGKWQTKSDSMEDGITADLEYFTVNAKWDITENLNFEAIFSDWQQFQRQVIDFDGTEFLITTDDIPQERENQTIELHLSGSAFNDRLNWLAGYYSLDEDLTQRFYRWAMWEFVVPATSTVNPTTGFVLPATTNTAYTEYVRQTAGLLNLNGFSGGNMLTGTATYPWFFNVSDDALTNAWDEDEAWFGEVTFGVTEKLDLTFGARVSDKTGGDIRYVPSDAFRTPDPAVRPQGDPFAYSQIAVNATTGEPQNFVDPDKPTIETYKFSAAYQATTDIMFYLTYAEGFTSASSPLITIGPTSVISSIPASMNPVRVSATQARVDLPPELIDNTEIGLRSDWLDGRLRFNATYFESDWNGMRVALLPSDAAGNTQPFPYQSGDGAGTASGFEFEVVWAPTDRLTLNYGLGLIDTEYIQAGVLTGPPGQASITGNYPGAPFAYAPEQSYSIGAQYEIPTPNGGRFLLVGNYGWRDDYARDAAYQRTFIDQNGNPVLEPSYGILNSRFVYEPAARNYSVELWGKNLTDELYVNGGFDTRDIWGYDFSVVGRSREVGLSLSFTF